MLSTVRALPCVGRCDALSTKLSDHISKQHGAGIGAIDHGFNGTGEQRVGGSQNGHAGSQIVQVETPKKLGIGEPRTVVFRAKRLRAPPALDLALHSDPHFIPHFVRRIVVFQVHIPPGRGPGFGLEKRQNETVDKGLVDENANPSNPSVRSRCERNPSASTFQRHYR
jgi:hypothetical protein